MKRNADIKEIAAVLATLTGELTNGQMLQASERLMNAALLRDKAVCGAVTDHACAAIKKETPVMEAATDLLCALLDLERGLNLGQWLAHEDLLKKLFEELDARKKEVAR